jgi:hypothetical protein
MEQVWLKKAQVSMQNSVGVNGKFHHYCGFEVFNSKNLSNFSWLCN